MISADSKHSNGNFMECNCVRMRGKAMWELRHYENAERSRAQGMMRCVGTRLNRGDALICLRDAVKIVCA